MLYFNGLLDISERFLGVQIERLDAFSCIRKYDTDETLFYLDPPYCQDTRTAKKIYKFEVDENFHRRLAIELNNIVGFAVISGYKNTLYQEIYNENGWLDVDKMAATNTGGKRVESLWLSPRTVEALGVANKAMNSDPKERGQISML